MARILVGVLVLVLAAVAAQAYTVNGEKGARLFVGLHGHGPLRKVHKRHAPVVSGDERQEGEKQHENSEQQGKPSLLAKLKHGLDTAKHWVKKATVIGHDVIGFVAKDKAILEHAKQHASHDLKSAWEDVEQGNVGKAVDKVSRLVKGEAHDLGDVAKAQVRKLKDDVKEVNEPQGQEQPSTLNQEHPQHY